MADQGTRDLVPGGERLRALIVTGRTDIHHDWRTVTPMLAELLRSTGRFDVRVTEEFRGAGPETLEPYDVNLVWSDDADVEVLLTGWDNPLRYTQVPEQCDALPGMGKEHPLAWTTRFGQGRVFATGLGHGPEAVSHPSFRGLFACGVEWAATGAVSIRLPEDFGQPVPGGDWWPTELEPRVRAMYESRKASAS